jgi:uncharacterized protein
MLQRSKRGGAARADFDTMTPAPASAVTAPALRRALVWGARRLIAARDGLNRINVFPVADGDTGNNLAATMRGLLHGGLGRRCGHAGELLQRVGDDAIDGARGNSGAILAQFLYGVGQAAGARQVLDAPSLAHAIRDGASQARGALAHPVEGTVLSVMDAFARAFAASAAAPAATPACAFKEGLAAAREALARTPRQMALLQRAGVVDAGASGFVEFLEGVGDYADAAPRARRLLRGALPAPRSADCDGDDALPAGHDEVDPARRWCTECLVVGDALDRDALRTTLERLDADSLVLAGGATRMRVHAHVDSPQALFDACQRRGRVEAMKADDMRLQARSVESSARVAIVTDSAADIPGPVAERHLLHVVPVRVTVDGDDYLDKVGLGTAAFYRRMAQARELPRTSQPPPGDFRRVFEFLRAHHDAVLYVGLAGAVSGTLQSAQHAAARVDGGGVHAFDSVNAAGGQALLAWRAAELAESGSGLEAIREALERLRPVTFTWAMARDIRHAVRGGRIPRWAGPVVRLSGLTPVARVRVDGKLGVAGGLFARARAPEAFAAFVARRTVRSGQGRVTAWRAIVGHCDAVDDGERLLAALAARLPLAESHLVETGPAVGTHAGRGALVVSLQPAPATGGVEPRRP